MAENISNEQLRERCLTKLLSSSKDQDLLKEYNFHGNVEDDTSMYFSIHHLIAQLWISKKNVSTFLHAVRSFPDEESAKNFHKDEKTIESLLEIKSFEKKIGTEYHKSTFVTIGTDPFGVVASMPDPLLGVIKMYILLFREGSFVHKIMVPRANKSANVIQLIKSIAEKILAI